MCFSGDGTMQTVCKILPNLKQVRRVSAALGLFLSDRERTNRGTEQRTLVEGGASFRASSVWASSAPVVKAADAGLQGGCIRRLHLRIGPLGDGRTLSSWRIELLS